jgi:hypothetical protein
MPKPERTSMSSLGLLSGGLLERLVELLRTMAVE